MGRSDKLVKNISFIVIGNIGSKLMGFFMLPFYTNWLSPADYGRHCPKFCVNGNRIQL